LSTEAAAGTGNQDCLVSWACHSLQLSSYVLDKKIIGEGPLEDGFLQFTKPASRLNS